MNIAGSGKLQALQQMLREWYKHEHRVLIFSQTRMMLDIMENLCEQEGHRYIRMDGTTHHAHRQELIDRFNEDESIFVALLTTRVGGIGVNLVGADRVVIFDPDWNPITDVQARERAWRIGQTREVCVYRFITSGTVEEAILRRQLAKTYVTEKVLHDPTLQRFFHSTDSFVENFFLGLDYDARVPANRRFVLSPFEVGAPSGYHGGVAVRGENTKEEKEKKEGSAVGSGSRVTAHMHHDQSEEAEPMCKNEMEQGRENNSRNSNRTLADSDVASATATASAAARVSAEREFGELYDMTPRDHTSALTGSAKGGGGVGDAEGIDAAETRLLRQLMDGQELIVTGGDAVSRRLAQYSAEQSLRRVAQEGVRTMAQQQQEFSLLRAAELRRAKERADREEQRQYYEEEERQRRLGRSGGEWVCE